MAISVQNYLQENFPLRSQQHEGELVFQDTMLHRISFPTLSKHLKYNFYKAHLVTGYFEYMLLEIIVAVNQYNSSQIVILKSPTFSSDDQEFLKLFQNISIDTKNDKQLFSKEIAMLFKEITYNGKVGELENLNPNIYSFELWHNDLSWRIFDFTFKNDILFEIVEKNGVKRGKMIDSYKRVSIQQ